MKASPKSFIGFLDESASLERSLSLIAVLLLNTERLAELDGRVIHEIGESIGAYLDRRRTLEHVCFGRKLDPQFLDPLSLKFEILRLKAVMKGE